MVRPVISHRGSEFHALYRDLQAKSQRALRTQNPVLFAGGGGWGAIDTIFASHPSSAIAVLVNDYFAERCAHEAQRAGHRVYTFQCPNGLPFPAESVTAFLAACPRLDAVVFVAHETGIGLANDPNVLAPAVRAACPDALLIVDVVSLAPAFDFDPDALAIDILVASSTKAMMGPPGLGLLTISERAAAVFATTTQAPFSLSITELLRFHQHDEMPSTPAVPILFGLQAALDRLDAEGREIFLLRHREAARTTRQALANEGLIPVVSQEHASPTLTAIWLPPGVDARDVANDVRTRFHVVLATGRGSLADRVIRVAHMGHFDIHDIEEAVWALSQTLRLTKARAA